MAGEIVTYPKRPSHFAHKFTRILIKACVANELGTDAVMLLITIAHTEDAKGYRGPVTYWNGQLCPIIGAGSESAFRRTRAKCMKSGWLICNPGTKGKAATYWVTVPPEHCDWDDAPTDESMGDYGVPDHIPATTDRESEQESGGKANRKAVGKRWESEQHSSLSQEEDKTPSESCTASPMPDASSPESSSPPKKTKKPRATPDSIHHQAIAAFCDGWRNRYGANYPFNGGKDGDSIKAILNHLGRDLESFTATVSRYLADDDPFVVKACHGIGLFRSQLAKWLTDSPQVPLNGVSTKDQQTAERLNAVIQEAQERMENEQREAEYAEFCRTQPPELEAHGAA